MSFLRKLNAALMLVMLMLALGGCAGASAPCMACDLTPEPAAAVKHSDWTWTRDQRAASTYCFPKVATAVLSTEARRDATPNLRRAALQATRLHILGGSISARQAAILIGGIHDTYRYFSSWVAPLSAGGKLVIGWDHDHHSMTMASAARLLARDLATLRNAGIADVTIIAHSIGGLVAKGAIDELSRNHHALAFDRLDLHAFGSPWGGFAVVKIALDVPGSSAVSTAFGYPMARELRPRSSFLRSLARPMPANGALHLYVGKADYVALPGRSSTRQRYAAAAVNAASVTTINEAAHSDYIKALTPASLAVGSNGGACRDGLCNATTEQQRCAAHPLATASLEANAARKVSANLR